MIPRGELVVLVEKCEAEIDTFHGASAERWIERFVLYVATDVSDAERLMREHKEQPRSYERDFLPWWWSVRALPVGVNPGCPLPHVYSRTFYAPGGRKLDAEPSVWDAPFSEPSQAAPGEHTPPA